MLEYEICIPNVEARKQENVHVEARLSHSLNQHSSVTQVEEDLTCRKQENMNVEARFLVWKMSRVVSGSNLV